MIGSFLSILLDIDFKLNSVWIYITTKYYISPTNVAIFFLFLGITVTFDFTSSSVSAGVCGREHNISAIDVVSVHDLPYQSPMYLSPTSPPYQIATPSANNF